MGPVCSMRPAGVAELVRRTAARAPGPTHPRGGHPGRRFLPVSLLTPSSCRGDRELFLCQHASRTPRLQHRPLGGAHKPLPA